MSTPRHISQNFLVLDLEVTGLDMCFQDTLFVFVYLTPFLLLVLKCEQ